MIKAIDAVHAALRGYPSNPPAEESPSRSLAGPPGVGGVDCTFCRKCGSADLFQWVFEGRILDECGECASSDWAPLWSGT
jgi:hypothetical protein